jgi:NOL1/NOP2/fmu family ribosome biogenesis protein
MSHESTRFDRVPATEAERDDEDPEQVTREEILDFWEDRYGVPRPVFDDYTFWERGAGKIWIFRGDAPSPVDVEGLGMTFLRTRQEHWKPTTEAVQRFGGHADKCTVHLDADQAATFVAGEDQELADWEGDWGYLIVSHDLVGESEPMGVGLYLYGELRSQVPKGRQRAL